MEPKIRYCTSADGTSIAFWEMGEGPPLVYLPPLPQHAQLEWRLAENVSFYEWLTSRHTVVRFDVRNTGLSQRGVGECSIEAQLSDVEAVLTRLGIESFSLFGHGLFAALAMHVAAAWPERVERLLLVETAYADQSPMPARAALAATLPHDWETYSEVMSGIVWGWGHRDRPANAQLFRDSVNAEDIMCFYELVRHELPPLSAITVPTLVVHHRDSNMTSVEDGRRLAAEIPDAHLVLLEGRYVGESVTDPRMRAAADDFLGAHLVKADRSPTPSRGGTQTVLFTDLVGHTEMMQRLGDTRGREVLREHERITRETLKNHGGTELKTDGDSFMASFASASSAIDCAIALQRAFAAREGEPLHVRIGLNAGEPVEDDGDLFGSSVILAARVKDQAGAGEILIPEPVRHLLTGKSFLFTDRGEFVPKGFDDAVRLYEVRWRE